VPTNRLVCRHLQTARIDRAVASLFCADVCTELFVARCQVGHRNAGLSKKTSCDASAHFIPRRDTSEDQNGLPSVQTSAQTTAIE
jgi:hypothetical protein